MSGRPRSTEAAAYYFTYIDQVKGEGAVGIIERQLGPPLVMELYPELRIKFQIQSTIKSGVASIPSCLLPARQGLPD